MVTVPGRVPLLNMNTLAPVVTLKQRSGELWFCHEMNNKPQGLLE